MAKKKATATETENKKYALKLVPKSGIETIPTLKTQVPEEVELEATEIDGTLFFFVPDGLMQGAKGDDFARFAQDVRDETGKNVVVLPSFFDIAKCEIVEKE